MKTVKLFATLLVACLTAACGDDKDNAGDFGQIKVPDTRQLEQTAAADATQTPRGVTFTTEAAWSSSIAETRADVPDWISIAPDHGDAAGTYTLAITLQKNASETARTAVITIACGTTTVAITVTQQGDEEGGDEPSERGANGRLVRITEYVDGSVESTADITYDEQGRIATLKIVNDYGEPYSDMSFTYDSPGQQLLIDENFYDKLPTNYGNSWVCQARTFREFSMIEQAECSYKESNIVKTLIYTYNKDGQIETIRTIRNDEHTTSEDEDRYTYADGNCTRIDRFVLTGMDTQLFSYPDNKEIPSDFTRLFAESPSINPALYVIYDPDMLQMLGFLGRQSRQLPVKVVSQGKESVTQTLEYKYNTAKLESWGIGEQIDGMEILVTDDSKKVSRYVLTFDGI